MIDISVSRRSFLSSAIMLAGSNRVAKPEDFGAVADGKSDCAAAINKCIDHLGRLGGGTILFTDGDYHLTGANPYFPTSSPTIFPIRYDNIEFVISKTAIVTCNCNQHVALFDISGSLKPFPGRIRLPSIRDSNTYSNTSTIYTPYRLIKIEPILAGSQSIKLLDPTDHVFFDKGDNVFIRAGGTLLRTEPMNYNNPFAEYNGCTGVDSVMGILHLSYPVRFNYGPSRYPSNHVKSGDWIPWGLINASRPLDVVQKGFRLSGEGLIRMFGNDKHCMLIGGGAINQFIGGGLRLELSGNLFSCGFSQSEVRDIFVRSDSDVTDVICNDSSNHYVTWRNIKADCNQAYVHLHEATTNNSVQDTSFINRTPYSDSVSVRAYASNNKVTISVIGTSASPPMLIDQSCINNVVNVNIKAVGSIHPSAVLLNLGRMNIITGEGLAVVVNDYKDEDTEGEMFFLAR